MRWLSWGAAASGVAVLAGACIATAPDGINRQTDGQGGSGSGALTTNNTTTTGPGSGPDNKDPHQVIGASPPHGPFTGQNHVILHGKGFEPDVRVWFGAVEAEDVIAIDPTQVQVSAPAHEPGEVDVSAQNGDDDSTRRTLPSGYTYDALYAQPDKGPTAGGTIIHIRGYNTSWDEDLEEVLIDQKPCTVAEVLAPDEIRCTVPQGTPGAKPIDVVTSQDTISSLDAYTYADSEDGFKGGLSGLPLAGSLKVLVYDNFSGYPVPAAHVVVGDDVATGLYQQTDASGVVVFNDASLDQPRTVTVAAECHSPITFVDVPVDTATIYLDPVLTPQCADMGEIPPGGGTPVLAGYIDGQLVWPSTQEFQKGDWANIPAPGPGESRVAYVFFATRNRSGAFILPSAAFTVTEASPGELGYGFNVPSYPGNQTMYALAGILDAGDNRFTAYAMGAVKGVAVEPGQETEAVVIRMETSLDQALTLDATPPPAGVKGPDRLHANVAIELSHQAYAILPNMNRTPLLPLTSSVSFVGLPGLDGDLTGARYITSGDAVTGPQLAAPLSVVRDVATTTTSIPVDLTGFVRIPELVAPVAGGPWDGRDLSVDYPSGGFPVDLTVYEITAGGGLWRWIVAVPAGAHDITVPDLTGFEGAHLPGGSIVIGVYGARIEDFDYGSIGFAELRPGGMDAYSLDFFNAHL
jgi:hypothetical protein